MPLWQPMQFVRNRRLSPPGLRLTSWRIRSGHHVVTIGLELLVMVIVRIRITRQTRYAGGDVQDVVRKQAIERHVVANHANDRGNVVVQRNEHIAVAVCPRRDKVLQCHIVEIGVVHRRGGRSERVVVLAWVDVSFHRSQYGFSRRYASEAIVHALGLLPRTRIGSTGHAREKYGEHKYPRHPCELTEPASRALTVDDFLSCPRYVFHSVPAHDQYDQNPFDSVVDKCDPKMARIELSLRGLKGRDGTSYKDERPTCLLAAPLSVRPTTCVGLAIGCFA